jgi:cell wall-associated NlpC family hydrolase
MSDGLLPSVEPADRIRIDRELPEEARTWRRVADLTQLEPGDLLLFRSIEPDEISNAIVAAQKRGFHERHAQWTHAAVYLGDDEHVCEANFKVPGSPYGVNIRSVFCYCDGKHAIRARRPRNMDAKTRLRIAIGALANIGSGYNFRQIVEFGNAVYRGDGVLNSFKRVPTSQTQSFVCSTLYQDAYNFALGNTVRATSRCTPAHLSSSADFDAAEPALRWLEII